MKKIFINLTTIICVITPTILLSNCGHENTEKIRSTDFPFKLNWDDPIWEVSNGDGTHHYSYIDLEMQNHCVDGDTFGVSQPTNYFDHPSIPQKHSVSQVNGNFPNIRVAGIDTPESHFTKDGNLFSTTGEEKIWADKATNFCNKYLIQDNLSHRIRIIPGENTYNRIAAYVFYGPEFQKSYSVEIMKKGLALPFITISGSTPYRLIPKKYEAFRYVALPIVSAWRNSIVNKIGLGKEVDRLTEILITHGSTNTPDKKEVDTLTEIFNSYKN